MPVLVDLRCASLSLPWNAPRPRLPDLLLQPFSELRASEEWASLTENWQGSAPYQHLFSLPLSASGQALSSALSAAMEALVELAGGWTTRNQTPRPAYESATIRHQRRSLDLLGRARSVLNRELFDTFTAGSFSYKLQTLLHQLHGRGLAVPASSRPALLRWLDGEIRLLRAELSVNRTTLRRERETRWVDSLPTTWSKKPGKLYSLLRDSPRPLGSIPILAVSGLQCTSLESVDLACISYWRDTVWCRHANVDEAAQWNSFLHSPFAQYLPQVRWPDEVWTLDRVQSTLRSMCATSSPGVRGIPVSIWKSLPPDVLGTVARLLTRVEEEGRWPKELLSGYVSMIPKASGGTRPQDQRPIAVLDVLYRLWAKATVRTWKPTLQGAYLGQSAMGFRSQTSTLHLAQLLSDIIQLEKKPPRGVVVGLL